MTSESSSESSGAYRLNDFIRDLYVFGGTTAACFANKPNQPVFFQPIQSSADFAFRSLCIVTAPLVFTVVAIATAFVGLFYFPVQALVNALKGDTEEAIENLALSAGLIISAGIALFAAAFSPLIQAIDIVGSLTCPDDTNNPMEFS